MRTIFNKYLVLSVAIMAIFSVGFVLGCVNKDRVTTATGKTAVRTSALPAEMAGIHIIPATGTIQFAFSPNGGITAMIVQELAKAQKQILVQAYSFTSADIAKALTDAKKRGIDVKVILDKSQETEKYSSAKFLSHEGIPVHIDRDFQIAHNKIMIIDGINVITGSFNFTKSAEQSNAENCEIQQGNQLLAAEFTKYWQWRWNATEDYAVK